MFSPYSSNLHICLCLSLSRGHSQTSLGQWPLINLIQKQALRRLQGILYMVTERNRKASSLASGSNFLSSRLLIPQVLFDHQTWNFWDIGFLRNSHKYTYLWEIQVCESGSKAKWEQPWTWSNFSFCLHSNSESPLWLGLAHWLGYSLSVK